MKNIFCFFTVIMLLFQVSCRQAEHKNYTPETYQNDTAEDTISNDRQIINYTCMKAIWLSQFDLYKVYTDNGSQRDISNYTEKIEQIICNINQMSFNTIILQVRPNCDSFYPSELFPPSKYAVGDYTKKFEYDPIRIILDIAHKYNISVQAWVNPYRCMNENEIKQINDTFFIKKLYSDYDNSLVLYNGYYYLDPYYESNQKLIKDGITEILNNYNFDGIHIDDYFYPTSDCTFDEKSFKEYKEKGGLLNLADFRRDNINKLVREIYNITKSFDKKLIFGISPAGNIKNTYENSFADIYTWCSDNTYIDYISPQIYFGLHHQTHPFEKVLNNWADIIKTSDISLIPGITLEKAYTKFDKWAGSGKNEWADNNDIIKKCIELSLSNNKCNGISFFSYQFFFDITTNLRIKETYNEIENFMPLFLSMGN